MATTFLLRTPTKADGKLCDCGATAVYWQEPAPNKLIAEGEDRFSYWCESCKKLVHGDVHVDRAPHLRMHVVR